MLGSLVCEATFPCLGLDMMYVSFAIVPVAPAREPPFGAANALKARRVRVRLHFLASNTA